MEEIDLESYADKTVKRRYEIEGTLTDIHGEHARRTQMISKIVYDEALARTEEEKETMLKRSAKRTTPEEVHTFPKDDEGNLLVPLGGSRGYLMGALRFSVYDLYKDKLKNKSWEGYGIGTYIGHGIFISPEWVPVGKEFSNPPESPRKYMVQTKGIGGGMMDTYYDFVEETPFKLTIDITNEKIPENLFLEMLSHAQMLGIGPKRRGRIKFNRVVKVK